jgi:hypothetical protein
MLLIVAWHFDFKMNSWFENGVTDSYFDDEATQIKMVILTEECFITTDRIGSEYWYKSKNITIFTYDWYYSIIDIIVHHQG